MNKNSPIYSVNNIYNTFEPILTPNLRFFFEGGGKHDSKVYDSFSNRDLGQSIIYLVREKNFFFHSKRKSFK